MRPPFLRAPPRTLSTFLGVEKVGREAWISESLALDEPMQDEMVHIARNIEGGIDFIVL